MKDSKKGMNIKDEKFVKDLFDQDGVEVPDSLSAENMMMKLAEAPEKEAPETIADSPVTATVAPEREELEKVTVKPEKVTVKRSWKKQLTAVLAACACLLLVLVPALNAEKTDPLKDIAEGEGSLTTFTSYKEIQKVLDSITEEDPYILYESEGDFAVNESARDGSSANGSAAKGSESYGSAADGSAAAPNAAASNGAASAGHSDTYLQVKGVDEADRVKCDDGYLYYISSQNNRIYICRADDGRARRAAEIKAPEDRWFKAMFLDGDRLITVAGGYYGYTETEVAVYDISDRNKPVKSASYVQSGSPVSQRMADGVVYLVTDRYADAKDIPYCGAEGKTKKLKPEEICCVPDPVSPEYTVIGAVDVSSGEELSHVTKAVLGGSQDIYSNGENLYVAGLTFIKDKKEDGGTGYSVFPGYRGTAATVVIKIKMAKGDISLEKTAVVKGTLDDQFSMDERDGNFRIATTSVDDKGQDINNLFVLDRDLKLLGKVTGFARNETIRAVRYVKDKAYVITYEQTDPLFVIDLSDSSNPKIEGEVKIDGFSTLLVPMSEDRLLGIGYDVQEVDTWQETAGLKFVIFDVSDPSKPKVVTSKVLDGIYSDVQDDHRGLVVLGEGEEARYVLPCWEEYEEYAEDVEDAEEDMGVEDAEEDIDVEDAEEDVDVYEYEDYKGGALEITAKDGKINVLDYHKTRDSVSRCPVIGEYIYAICDNDQIEAFRIR